MRRAKSIGRALLLAPLLASPAGAGAEVSWLDAEVRVQEARWAAQQGRADAPRAFRRASRPVPARRTAPPAPISAFPPIAARPVPAPVPPEPAAIVRPPAGPAAEDGDLARAILAAAGRHGVDPLLVKAVILAESGGRRWATSSKGAMGLMQLMPATARRFGVADPYDPEQNVGGGAAYLRWLLDRFGGNVTLALAGYNAGEGAVDRHGGVPPYRETQNYVGAVQRNHRLLNRQVAGLLARKRR